MPLASISAPPTDQTQNHFDFAHYNDHLEILQAINKQHGKTLAPRPIYPAGDQGYSWKRLHQAMHTEMNAALGTNGQNLLGAIDNTWHNQNYSEHQAAHAVLRI
jgi:hypothetical protein